MSSFLTVLKMHSRFRQLLLLSGLCLLNICHGQTTPAEVQVGRRPSNYIPDDDVIMKPVDNEMTFYQQYIASDNSSEVVKSRNQLKIWNENQTFADQYGLDSNLAGSPYFVPNSDQKWEYFKDKYMRYLRRKGEQPLKDMPKTWYSEYRASNEVDTIDEMESRFKDSNESSNSPTSNLPDSLKGKEVSVWKNTKFIFQPRLDQGLVIVGIKGPFDARAWVGVNGKAEFNVSKSIDSIGFRVMYNYDVESRKYFTSLDQRLADNIYARITSSKDQIDEERDNTFMLLYARSF